MKATNRFGLPSHPNFIFSTKNISVRRCLRMIKPASFFPFSEVHDIAEQVEHIQSAAFFEKMEELLGYLKIDPHGSPIPDKNGKMGGKEYSKLSDCKAGETVKLAAVINTSSKFLKYLNSREMQLGLKMTITSVEAFNKSMVISYAGHSTETLSHLVCERLLVEK